MMAGPMQAVARAAYCMYKTFTLNSINGSFPPKGMHYMYTLIAVRTCNRNVTRALKCMAD